MSWLEPFVQFGLRLKHRLRRVVDISPAEATRMIERGAAVLDVREQAERDWARLAESIHIPLADLEERITELEQFRDSELLVICHGGLRSGQACEILSRHGFKAPANLAGGILAWRAQGLPAEGSGRWDPSVLKAIRPLRS